MRRAARLGRHKLSATQPPIFHPPIAAAIPSGQPGSQSTSPMAGIWRKRSRWQRMRARFEKGQAGLSLVGLRTSYELAELAPVVVIEDGEGKHPHRVVPDAWLRFVREEAGRERSMGLLLEIDRGREYQAAFKAHVASRVEFIASGAYGRLFAERGGVRIATEIPSSSVSLTHSARCSDLSRTVRSDRCRFSAISTSLASAAAADRR